VTYEDAVAADLARRAIAQAAPEELPLFRATSKAYFDDPEKTLAERGGRDEMLGFGVEAAVFILTPVALDVAKSVVAFVVAHVRTAAERHAGSAIDGAVERVFARFAGDEATEQYERPKLTPEQLDEVRRVAHDRARALDLPEAKAALLADALVGGLA
jgi:hypothetical protein